MGFLCFLSFIVITALTIILGGGSIAGFVDIPSLIVVAASILLFVVASGQWQVFIQGFKHFFQFHDRSHLDHHSAVKISRFFRILGFACPGMGFFWSIVGGIIMLGNLSPETIGNGLAIALLTLFYSCLLSVIVFFPISLYFVGVQTSRHRNRHDKIDWTKSIAKTRKDK